MWRAENREMRDVLEALYASDRYRSVDGVFVTMRDPGERNQLNVDAFFEKWSWTYRQSGADAYEDMQYRRYLEFYGFADTEALRSFLADKAVILDAGCGYGHKANWLSSLAPQATVIAMDLSDSVYIAKELYGVNKNLLFVKGDIGNTDLDAETIDFVNCDQVLHHTENPKETVKELARLTKTGGALSLYVYARKALPRELVDEFFLSKQRSLSHDEVWDLSQRLTELGRILSDLKVELDFPAIPQLDIKGGRQDLQRFFYENFLKCFWSPEIGREQSVAVNFDWYSPHIAHRFSEREFLSLATEAGLSTMFLHSESACHSGLFRKGG